MTYFRISLTILFIIVSRFCTTINAQPVPQKIQLSGSTQGSNYTVTYFDEKGRNFQIQIDALLLKFENMISLWNPNSQIVQVNQNKKITIDPLFADIIKKSLSISEATGGAFDITVGGLVGAWGFAAKKREELNQHKIDSMLRYVGYKKVTVKNNHVIKTMPQVTLDVNAIAQGYTSDLVGKFLDSCGITSYLVDMGGGEILAKGLKPDKSPWIVGIEKPTETKDGDRKVLSYMALIDKAVVTSGDYRKYFEINGKRYAHHIDPKTGYPTSHNLLSVSVTAHETWEADAIAAAFMVMGMEKALEFLKTHKKYEAHFVYIENGVMKTYITEGLKQFMPQNE